LPEGFQRAEYLKSHGMVDMVAPRSELRPLLARLCKLLTHASQVDDPSRSLNGLDVGSI